MPDFDPRADPRGSFGVTLRSNDERKISYIVITLSTNQKSFLSIKIYEIFRTFIVADK